MMGTSDLFGSISRSPSTWIEVYLPGLVTTFLILSHFIPSTGFSKRPALFQLFDELVTPQDVLENNAQEAQAEDERKRTLGLNKNGQTLTSSYGSAENAAVSDKLASRSQAEATPLIGSKRTITGPPLRVKLILTLVPLVYLLVWTAVLAFVSIGGHVTTVIGDQSIALQTIATVHIACWVYAFARAVLTPSPTPQFGLLGLYMAQLAATVVSGYNSIFQTGDPLLHHPPHFYFLVSPIFHGLSALLILLALSAIVSLPLQVFDPFPVTDSSGIPPPLEDYCTLWDWITFRWVNPLIDIGSQRPLQESDVWQISKHSKSKILLNKFLNFGTLESPTASSSSPSLLKKIFFMNLRDISLDLSLALVSVFLQYSIPFFIKRVIESLQEVEDQSVAPITSLFVNPIYELAALPSNLFKQIYFLLPTNRAHIVNLAAGKVQTISQNTNRQSALLFALCSFLCHVIKSQTDLQHLYYGRRASIRIKSQLVVAIYHKALRKKDVSGMVEQKTSGEAQLEPDRNESGNHAAKNSSSQSNGQPKQDTKKAEGQDLNSANVGKIVNLMAADAQQISMLMSMIFMAFTSPIELIIAPVFLFSILGWSAFAGIAVIFISMPLQSWLTQRSIRFNKKMMTARDKRMTSLNELIQSIRFIKFFAWERGWTARVLKARDEELNWQFQLIIYACYSTFMWAIVPTMIIVSSFASFVLIEKKSLDVATAFTAISIFDMLSRPLMVLPYLFNTFYTSYVNMQRIDAFLQEDEVPKWVIGNRNAGLGATPDVDLDQHHIEIRSGTFQWASAEKKKDQGTPPSGTDSKPLLSWWNFGRKKSTPRQSHELDPNSNSEGEPPHTEDGDGDDDPFLLSDINFKATKGKLTLVCGPTGSGKSSLLAALLGEMELLSGSVSLAKRSLGLLFGGVAYCAQTPWLETFSIKDNILFGQAFDAARYDRVLEVCCLKPDLHTLPHGDNTEIGERGVSLSGGQKARVALARAMYSRAPNVLLDDILSAVDSHTASKLINDCLQGELMSGRTIVLITHHIEAVLPVAERVVMMENGRIVANGSVASLRDEGRLAQMLAAEHNADKGKQAAKDEIKAEQDKDAEVSAQVRQQGKVDPHGPQDGAAVGSGNLIEKETKSEGSVKKEIYLMYMCNLGWGIVAAVVANLLINRVLDIAEKVWISYWGSSYENKAWHGIFPPASQNAMPYLLIYAAIVMSNVIFISLLSAVGQYGSWLAGRRLFKSTLHVVVRSTLRFFDQTPSGRILNRFSKDIETIDTTLFGNIKQVIVYASSCMAAIFAASFAIPIFVLPALVIGYIYYSTAVAYIRTARDLRRMESVSRSPIFQSFSEVLNGLMTVRAFGAQDRFLESLFRRLDTTQSCFNLFWMSNRWLLLRFDILGALIVLLACLLCLAGGVPAGLAGLAITQAEAYQMSIYWLCRAWTGFEMDLNSVERIHEYQQVPQEPPAIIESNRPPATWPSKNGGKGIQVSNLVLRYAPTLPPVLKGISFDVKPGEKVGLVGRTGSGKSTLALALFRFVEFDSGSVVIDGVDISKIGLEDLRSRLTIIPQDPVLFSGTIRDNLDPFGQRTDQECIAALKRVQLRGATSHTTATNTAVPSRAGSFHETNGESGSLASSFLQTGSPDVTSTGGATSTAIHLDTQVSEGGNNFSQGQRQLLSLARALLRSSSIIIMDEATASVDFQTDSLIQQTLRSPLQGEDQNTTTIITIAHRLKTIIDYDRILVLDQGQIVEYGSPANLIEKQGVFYEMCKKTGEMSELVQIANDAERKKVHGN